MTVRRPTPAQLLAAIVAVAAALRLYGVRWGLPFHFHSDEQVMFHFTEKLRTARSIRELTHGDMRFFLYAPLLMHLLIGCVWVAGWFHRFAEDDPASLTLYLAMGRAIVAVFGTATVWLVYRLGARLYSRGAGILGAALLAVCTLHVRDSHFFVTDIPLTFFLAAELLSAARLVEEPRPRRYVELGAVLGIAMATKQTALLGVPLVAVAHAVVVLRRPRSEWGWWVLGWPALAGAVAALAFSAAYPYVWIAPGNFLAMSRKTASFVSASARPPWVWQFDGTSFGYWFTNVLFFGMGPLLELAALAGLVWAAKRRQLGDLLLVALLVPYTLVVGRGFMKFVRYALPVLPLLCLWTGRLGAEALAAARTRATRSLVAGCIAAVIVTSLGYSIAYLHVYRKPDARLAAARWIHSNIPLGASMLVDSSPSTPPLGHLFLHPSFFDSYIQGQTLHASRDDYFSIKVLDLSADPAERAKTDDWWRAYLGERTQGVDYIAISDEYAEQYRAALPDFPVVNQFLSDLIAGRTEFELVREWKTRPALFGQEIPDDHAELTFRLFDHPRVMVFRRRVGPA